MHFGDDIPNLLADIDNAKKEGIIIKKSDSLFLLKYDKKKLQKNFEKLSKYRSVITNGERLLCFSPVKSIPEEDFMHSYKINDCIFEEFVEGTMINCFFNDWWWLSTRSNIGAANRFYADQKSTFGEMFLEAMSNWGLTFDDLNKKYCYSFVLQHPANRIVIPFKQPRIILVAVYELTDWDVKEIRNDKLQFKMKYWQLRPQRYNISNLHEWQDLKEKYASMNTDYKILGIMMKHPSGARSKVRNPVYEKVRQLRGNSPKSQFLFYNLYQQKRVMEYLQYYPEQKKKFWQFRRELEKWTLTLLKLYQDIYIYKKKTVADIQYALKPHVYNLHQKYLNELRPKSISHKSVVEYVKQIPPARLMFAINYPLRQKQIEEGKSSLKLCN